MQTILVIDDDCELRETIRRMIEGGGYRFLGADNGVTGVALFRAERPDLVITDIYMPDKDGLETVRDIRAIDPKARILAVSGGGTQCDLTFLKVAQMFGAIASLPKPFRQRQLIEAIGTILNEPALRAG